MHMTSKRIQHSTVGILSACLLAFAANGQSTPSPPTSVQDPKSAYREMLCGNQGMPPTSTQMPSIGCFGVPSGGNAAGKPKALTRRASLQSLMH
jgi:hypothetical protein